MKLFIKTNSHTAIQHVFQQLTSSLAQSLGSGIFLCIYLMAKVYDTRSARIIDLKTANSAVH
jgi:hypothetical protein